MKIDVNQSQKTLRYELKINDELILISDKLGEIVDKAEQYLKMRFLKTEQKGGLKGAFSKIING